MSSPRPHRPSTPHRRLPRVVVFVALVIAALALLPVAGAAADIHPHIDSLSASYGVPGNTLTITGYGFGAAKDTANIGFDAWTNAASIASWSDTQIVCTVPVLTHGYGLHYIDVWDMNGYYSNELPYTVEDPDLWVHSLTPSHAAPGRIMTVTGHGFGASQGSGFVECFGAAGWAGIVAPTVWSDAKINFVLPAGVTTGKHELQVYNGITLSNSVVFNVDPAITSLSPTKAYPGATVTLKGTGFGPKRGVSKVYFGATAATSYVKWTGTLIKVKVPVTSAGSKPCKVKTKFGTSKTKAFKVL